MAVSDRIDPLVTLSEGCPSLGTAEVRAADEVRMGYQECTVPGCACQAWLDPYNGSTLCSNCGHDYSLHN